MLDRAGAGQEIMRPNLTTKLPERSSSTNGSSGDNWITKQLAERRGKNYKRNDAIKFGEKMRKIISIHIWRDFSASPGIFFKQSLQNILYNSNMRRKKVPGSSFDGLA